MKKFLDGILVVEGNHDASYISNYIDTEIVILNGLELRDLDYIKYASNFKKIYLLTDPDETGKQIREKINNQIKVINIEININKCNKSKYKKGVAECEIDEIINQLAPYLLENSIKQNKNISSLDLLKIENKDLVKRKFHLGKCNNKKMLERLNSLNIKKEELYGN